MAKKANLKRENTSTRKNVKTNKQLSWLPYEEWVKVRATHFQCYGNGMERVKKWLRSRMEKSRV